MEWPEALEASRPLRVRALQLQQQAARERAAALARWEQSEKPVLREHAAGLAEALAVLAREEEALRARMAATASSAVPSHPGTSTGFNVIRARADAAGRPLDTGALRAERDRLARALNALSAEIAGAKAEITGGRRAEELEIWETKLVALQDTQRVYREEINWVEVELLGREHFERMAADRAHAEATGEGRLRRVRAQALETRARFNRAKHQYYFPALKGWNIAFGGGGIYGACKDICISEIDGAFTLRCEPGGLEADGSRRPARVIAEFHAPADDRARGSPRRRSGAHAAAAGDGASVGSGGAASGSRPGSAPAPSPRPGPAASPRPGTSPASGGLHAGLARLSVGAGGATPPRRSAPHSAAPSPGARLASPERPPAAAAPRAPELTSRQQRARSFASKFVGRLGSRKERFSGKAPAHLEPARDEGAMVDGFAEKKRSLASKLLSRKASRGGSHPASDGSLTRLAFGGQELAPRGDGDGRREGGGGGEASPEGSPSVASDDSDDAGDEALDSVPELREGGGGAEEHDEGDGSLASESSDEGESGDERVASPLTRDALRSQPALGGGAAGAAAGSSSRGSWLRGAGSSAPDVASFQDDGASSVLEFGGDADDDAAGGAAAAAAPGDAPRGVFVSGRLSGFELVGERGTKVPNLTIGEADVRAAVFCKFVFEYAAGEGWRPGSRPSDRPRFHVEHLRYAIRGNNVPMPPTLVKHILRAAIPGLIQRRLMGLLPPELGEYLATAGEGAAFAAAADVGAVGPAVATLDADLGFEVRGPAKSAGEARRQAALYAAARQARALLGLSLGQAQVLAELCAGGAALLDPPRPATIASLIALRAGYDRHPALWRQLAGVVDAAYHVLVQASGRAADAADFSFPAFMDGPVARMRAKPARARLVVRSLDAGVNADRVVTALHDFTRRAIEEAAARGPGDAPAAGAAAELEVLHAWHAFALRELGHFKSKFRGAGATVLAAADRGGFSAGLENAHYEGPLRLRLPVALALDADGACSFELPLPGPAGRLGAFVDRFKELTVPAHMRPPAQALNWVELSGDSEVDACMRAQVAQALELVGGVLADLTAKIAANGLAADDADAHKALTQPRTMVADRLGRVIVNRLRVRARLDERRVGEILSGLDAAAMGGDGAAARATAARIVAHLGDVLTMAFSPAAPAAGGAPGQYLLQLESTDVSRLRADLQSLGFQSAVTPGGAVRLVHAVLAAAASAFRDRPAEELAALREACEGWYALLTREALDASACVDAAGEVRGGEFIVRLAGTADPAALRATSPLVLTNEIDLVPLGKAMRGDPPAAPPA
jgi:hypothetical protein